MRQWLYQQLHLKMESSVMNVNSKEVATKLDENASFSDDVFKVPEGIKIEEMPDMSELMGAANAGRDEERGKGKRRVASSEGEEAPSEGGLAAMIRRAQEGSEHAERGGEAGGDQGVGLSYPEFKRLIAKVKVRDMGSASLESSGGSHTATYSKGALNLVIITAGAYTTPSDYVIRAKAGKEGGAGVLALKQFTKKGRPAVYTEVGAEGSEQKGAHLIIFDAAKHFTILITSQPARPRAELEELLTQLGY